MSETIIEHHIALLGLEVEDKVTKFKGIATSVSFELYGCIQVVVSPVVGDDGKIENGKWFEVTRLRVTNHVPVMEHPDYSAGYIAEGKKGADIDKPLP